VLSETGAQAMNGCESLITFQFDTPAKSTSVMQGILPVELKTCLF